MNKNFLKHLVSPKTHQPLAEKEGSLVTPDGKETYQVIHDVPILIYSEAAADWHRELMEVLLWQYPDRLDQMYKIIDFEKPPTDIYINYIRELLGNKENIVQAFERYAAQKTDCWMIKEAQPSIKIDPDLMEGFETQSQPEIGEERVLSTRQNGENGWATYLYFYKKQVHLTSPETIVEISTGAGFGTSAIADSKLKNTQIYTVDIGFNCHGNVKSIAKYLNIEDSLFSVCANFWSMPFPNHNIDVVCSNFGLDESRENDKTIAEISRVLKTGGRFVNVSRSNAFIRQYNILEPFGFTKDEALVLLRKARLYSDTDDLIQTCKENGLYIESNQDFQSGKYTVTVFQKE